MSNSELWDWAEQTLSELNELEDGHYRILSRCCRATLSGAINSKEYYDPILMKPYKPEIHFCPECGSLLDFYMV